MIDIRAYKAKMIDVGRFVIDPNGRALHARAGLHRTEPQQHGPYQRR